MSTFVWVNKSEIRFKIVFWKCLDHFKSFWIKQLSILKFNGLIIKITERLHVWESIQFYHLGPQHKPGVIDSVYGIRSTFEACVLLIDPCCYEEPSNYKLRSMNGKRYCNLCSVQGQNTLPPCLCRFLILLAHKASVLCALRRSRPQGQTENIKMQTNRSAVRSEDYMCCTDEKTLVVWEKHTNGVDKLENSYLL